MGPGRQQHGAGQVDHHHDLHRVPHRQQLLLRQPVEGPHEGRRQYHQHPGGIGRQRSEQLIQALVEEQPEAHQHHQQADALADAEALAKHEQAADQEQHRRHLDHQLRGTGAEQVEAEQVQHVVAGQPGDGQQQQPAAAPAERREARQAPAGRQVAEQDRTGHQQAIPGDGDRVHHLQHFLELDRQDAPEHGGDQGEEQAVEPAAGGDMHGELEQAGPEVRKTAILGSPH
ncbi:hypothetical protein D9M69_282940 [compost metagenome]